MGPHPSRTSVHKRRLAIVFGLTGFYLIAEVAGGFWTHSLALLADAGHMLTDVASLALALFAIRIAERPATPERTYGYHRVEILAAFINALALSLIALYILYEASRRFISPEPVATGPMIVIAFVGLLVNLIGIALLRDGSQHSLNLKGAYLEVLSDTLSSVGTILAGIVMWKTGWYYADPIVSVAIGLFVLPRSWTLLRATAGILLEGTPADVNLASLRDAIGSVEGVVGVHDLHVWTLTSGVHAMSAHVVVCEGGVHQGVLAAVQRKVATDFRIEHVTVQVELPEFAEAETHL